MTKAKARDLFSSYKEGSLDAGLAAALERAFEGDPDLRSEYEQFCALWVGLDSLRDESIPVPENLNRIIHERMEASEATAKKPLWRWQPLAALGLGAAAIAAFLLIFQPGQAPGVDPIGADLTTGVQADRSLRLDIIDDQLYLLAGQGVLEAIEITQDGLAEPAANLDVSGRELRTPLNNSSELPQVLRVKGLPSAKQIVIALPGQSSQPVSQTEGTVKDLALAIAQSFRMPVEIRADEAKEASWGWPVGATQSDVSALLSEDELTLESLESGLLVLSD